MIRPPALAALLIATLVVVFTNVSRYQDPEGERYVPVMAPGAADFTAIFAGTIALLHRQDPYHHDDATIREPWQRTDVAFGRSYHLAYQPSHFLLYVPLALFTTDARVGGRVIFYSNLAIYLLLALLTWWLFAEIAQLEPAARKQSLVLVPLFFVLYAANVGSLLCLERGQSDALNSACCWSALVLFLKRQRFAPMFLATSAVLIKGYGLVFAVGLGLLCVSERHFRNALLGALLALLVWLVPVARYLRDGFMAAFGHAKDFFHPVWLNQSFKNVFFQLSPSVAEAGRFAMTAVTLLVAAGAWRQAQSELRSEGNPTLSLSLFATSSLATMVGFSGLSYLYDQILVLPGALLLLSAGPADAWRLSRGEARALAALGMVTAFLLFKARWGANESVPLAGLGLVLLVLWMGAVVLRSWFPARS